ncbi:pirin family protein [Reichenbachiella agarivorans]|uniref:Pirin family protein n=1 Tax=Reichenbachiella agarivorans TaxID=2979464 RepID=A0ABY6CNA2_9BACT|nr:pirin family protein [Reichenbachiella agarivorans]UXP31510.1 pirin family protein [Reichenbachiella agarivorans]
MSDKIRNIQPLGFPWKTADPFLFCVHHRDEYPQGNEEMGPAVNLAGRNMGSDFTVKDGFRMYHGMKVPGFPSHPHRGFETVTVTKEGIIDHADSMGAAGRFGFGDVQWMTAGKGVQHSEMFPLLNRDKGNTLELFQIWLNLPSKSKMVQPYFSMFWHEKIPVIKHTDDVGRHSEIKIIAGNYNGQKALDPAPESWAAEMDHEVGIWTIQLDAGAQLTLPATQSIDTHRTLYFYQGTGLTLEGREIAPYHSIEVKSDEALTLQAGNSETHLLLLQGKPIKEPVVQHGPFVMNSAAEIQETMRDYGRTQFGGWPWPKSEQVHDRASGRFARHADGREERPV